MSILNAYIVPHPPLIIPEIGKGKEKEISDTIKAYHTIAEKIAETEPETIIISTPHSIMYSDYFHISPGKSAKGDFSDFGHPEVNFSVKYDEDFAVAISKRTENVGSSGEKDSSLDHGTMIPLYFLKKYMRPDEIKIVRVGLSGFSIWDHYKLGILIQKTSEALNRKTVYIASGDMSHKLKSDGPYGYSKEGEEFDTKVCKILKEGNFSELADFSESFLEKAAECGLRSFAIMAGALDGKAVESKMLSYEGPFGVGYGVFSYNVSGNDDKRKFFDKYSESRNEIQIKNPFIKLAKETIENYIVKGIEPEKISNPPEGMEKPAGVFVSLHKNGQLRGCIGTISATTANIAEEIQRNAIEASTNDPRFPSVQEEEIPFLDISVDVLGEAEEVNSLSDLDPVKYGVIVSSGYRRGLLLPNLEGVDTPDQQISITLRKAGIRGDEKFKIERFEVIRHEM